MAAVEATAAVAVVAAAPTVVEVAIVAAAVAAAAAGAATDGSGQEAVGLSFKLLPAPWQLLMAHRCPGRPRSTCPMERKKGQGCTEFITLRFSTQLVSSSKNRKMRCTGLRSNSW